MQFLKKYLRESWTRSLIKAVTYRGVILTLDFGVIYAVTGKKNVAIGFLLISNLYTTVAYFIHERVWERFSPREKYVLAELPPVLPRIQEKAEV